MPTYTMCQIRRHNHETSAWLVAGDTIYDATTDISLHPGGSNSILRKSGGKVDCTVDLNFHSRNGRDIWKKYIVGKVVDCPANKQQEQHHDDQKSTSTVTTCLLPALRRFLSLPYNSNLARH